MQKTCVKIVTLIFIIKLKEKGEELRVRAKIDDIQTLYFKRKCFNNYL